VNRQGRSEITQVNAPIINSPGAQGAHNWGNVSGLIYSIQLTNGMIITSPEGFRGAPETEDQSLLDEPTPSEE
jgi:hypothetical protein